MTGWVPLLASTDPVAHVVDKPIIVGKLFGQQLWLVSNATVMLVVGAIVTALLVIPAAKRITTGQQRTLEDYRSQGVLANLVESICLYLREDVFRPVLGDQTDRFAPVLWTFFWFILVCNLLGLVPLADITAMMGINHGHGIGGTATQSIYVTGGLAVVSFLFYNVTGFVNSPLGYLKHLTGGAPWFMWPIMVPIELLGMFIKPFALAIRLFANMTGGHLVLAVLLGFFGPLMQMAGAGKALAIIPLIGATAINMLELLVAFIQAYIFMFLTCLFLGQLVVHEHEDEEHGHPGHPGQPSPAAAGASGDTAAKLEHA